jgi:ribonuclease HII
MVRNNNNLKKRVADRSLALWDFDKKQIDKNEFLIGVDEVGRGCLAGDVVAAAVMVPRSFYEKKEFQKICLGIVDSKQIDFSKRQKMDSVIRSLQQEGDCRFQLAASNVSEIENLNIVGATSLAMQRCLDKLIDGYKPEDLKVIVDGRPMKRLSTQHDGVVKGDGKSLVIAMASILAKVYRDQTMVELSKLYPDYGFCQHKGYGTPQHLRALREKGVVEGIHRPRFLNKIITCDRQLEFDF